jgi:hypothetical protein
MRGCPAVMLTPDIASPIQATPAIAAQKSGWFATGM